MNKGIEEERGERAKEEEREEIREREKWRWYHFMFALLSTKPFDKKAEYFLYVSKS